MLKNTTIVKGSNVIDTPITLVKLVLEFYTEGGGLDLLILKLSDLPNEKGEQVFYKGDYYTPHPFNTKGLGQSMTGNNKPNLEISNANGVLNPLLLNHNNFKAGHCKIIKMFIRDTSPTNLEKPSDYRTEVSDGTSREFLNQSYTVEHIREYDESKAILKLSTARDTGKMIVEQIFSPLCYHEFKDLRCGYIGSDSTCKKTLSDCRAKRNTINFGGVLDTTK